MTGFRRDGGRAGVRMSVAVSTAAAATAAVQIPEGWWIVQATGADGAFLLSPAQAEAIETTAGNSDLQPVKIASGALVMWLPRGFINWAQLVAVATAAVLWLTPVLPEA